ncbi:MAG: zinc ribbon domain-containing protein, partial [Bacteroidota bacterium]
MEKQTEQSPKKCFNCGTPVKGDFCHNCGQRTRDNLDRSLGRLLGEFFGNVFFLDNRFLVSLWYLVRYPSRMSVEFQEQEKRNGGNEFFSFPFQK